MNLKLRNRQPEMMDDPEIDARSHGSALNGLRRVNALSLSSAVLWPSIRRLAREVQRPIRLLDVACGGGDVTCALARRARRERIDLFVQGCDRSAFAVERSREYAARTGVPHVEFSRADVFADALPDGFDVITCSLFLHHLDEAQAVHLLRTMAGATRSLVLVNDLRRTTWGYWLAWAGGRVLTRSRVVHVDGPRSVAAAFTPAEARDLADRAGLIGSRVTLHWPQRFLLSWRRP